jgi:hypothetical protein
VARQKKKKLRYFYLDNQLHKVISINHPLDECVAWNYSEERRVMFIWSDLRRRYAKAFTLTEVSNMIGRHRVNVERYIVHGCIRAPQRAYTLDDQKKPGKYFFTEENVYELYDYLLTVHIGRPRKDGKITPGRLPSRVELRAMMRHDVQIVRKTSGGEFVPVWKEINW